LALVKPATLFKFHKALVDRNPHLLLLRLIVTHGDSIAAVYFKLRLPLDWQFATHTRVTAGDVRAHTTIGVAFNGIPVISRPE
jgi:hypothetical protein